jgi:DNA-directed RNA polymerase subunit RPC12/RpoP
MALDLDKGFVYAEGVQRTSLDCTSCGKVFIAKINHDLNGNHKILCPYCGHEHWRIIKNGCVTGDRWGSQNGPNRDVPTERMWNDKTIGAETNTAAEHIRKQWLERS